MADTTIVNLPALAATPATDDLIEMVDISDTGNNATGENKKMTVAELVAAAAGGGGGMVLLETITNAAAGEFDFGPALAGGVIPQIYNRLVIIAETRSEENAQLHSEWLFFNNDLTSTNYYSQHGYTYNVANSASRNNEPRIGYATGQLSPAASYATIEIIIEGYAQSGRSKNARSSLSGELEADKPIVGGISVIHRTLTDPITRVQLQSSANATNQLFGVARLYGEM